MPRPVFLTGRFRSGSTLVWNVFRQVEGVAAYYEPLHPKLLHYLRHPPAPQPRHFHVASYFDEYPTAGKLGSRFSAEFGVSRLHLQEEDDHPGLESYLRYLLGLSEDRLPVLKFNRIDLRLPWIRRRFPDAVILHVHRSPRPVWASLLRAAGAPPDPGLEADPFHLTTWSRDLCGSFPFLAGEELRHLYQRHYYLWKLSLLAGSRLAHLSISYEALLDAPRETVATLFEAASLRKAAAVDAGLRVVVRSEGPASGHGDEAWFEDMEGECEARLDALGLNAHFGLRSLSEIAASSPAYRDLAADPRSARWALRSAQAALSGLEIEADEKELVIRDLVRAADERLALVERTQADKRSLEAVAEERQQAAQAQERVVTILQKRAENAEAAAEARLRVIEEQERALKAYRQRNLREWIRRSMAPRLGVLYQYAPRPLWIPERYGRVPPPSPCPTVSLVTPSLNQAPFIARTLDSVLDQRYPRLEYLVQDGGSTDETLPILKRYGDRIRYRSAKDGGQASALNQGFATTSGEVMAYLNADDCLLPGALSYVGDFFARQPEVDVVYGHRILIDEYDQEIGRWVLPPHDDAVLTFADYVPQETLFWRRRLWEKVGAHVDESFHFALDWDLLLRFRDHGARFVRLPRFLGAFRVHPHQKTSAEMKSRGLEEMDRLRRRCHGRGLRPTEIHRGVRSYLLRHLVLHKLYRAGLLRY